MSNVFKSNPNNSNSYYRNERPNNFLNKTNKKLFLFNNESFPDLVSPKNQENIKTEENSLFTKVLHAKIEEEEKEKERQQQEQEQKRWIVFKKSVPYQKQQEKEEKVKDKDKEQQVVEKQVDPRKVFKKLTKNYYTWKKNYVELWGQDDYEKHYRFPNHDYSYYETSDSNSDLEDY